jgi:hypothetical protein
MPSIPERSQWLEKDYRERRWFSLTEAVSLLAAHPVRSLLGEAQRILR